ncbi:MAG: segregation/condensation protein A [Ruminococcus sp.]|jgi:segregation and condensation protein A|nr:segregation/condensation protein A [Ruminococcus sp.]
MENSNALTFRLDNFEGPLDLLLYLISKHKMNINDIPIALLLEQYMVYINDAATDTEIEGEFLEMAARLLYIKTVSLLPQENAAEELKRELQGRLIELALIKAAAERLRACFMGESVVVRKPSPPETDNTYDLVHDKTILSRTYAAIIKHRKIPDKQEPETAFENIVHKKFYPVAEKITYILKMLYRHGKCVISDILNDIKDKSERVAAFLAVLEMTKSGRILLNENNTEIRFNR